jgi:2,4-diaminopentanoate dehydrogenase
VDRPLKDWSSGREIRVGEGRYRVVQWATGNIGLRSLRAVLEHPRLELVGLYVYSEAKVGHDAGALCGLEPTGVTATHDVDHIVSLQPDCVLYMADRVDADVLCRLLESGANVISTRSEFHNPSTMDPSVRERVEAACARGGSTLHSTGSSPGFITEALPFVLASLQRRLDRLVIEEFADMSSRNSPEMIFDLMGFGRDPSRFDPRGVEAHGGGAFAGSLRMVADAVGLPLDDVVATGRVAVARHPVEVAAGRLDAGTIAAQRLEVQGVRRGQPLLTFCANWYLTRDVEPAWDLRETGWHVVVEGDTPLDVAIRFPVPPDEWAATSPGLTAHRPVNAVPYVCAAAPGIRTSAELPQIIPTFG